MAGLSRRPGAGSRGFTLIELLMVIAIIGILSSIILASLQQSREKSYNAFREGSVHDIRTALELYYTKYGHYPFGIAFSVWSGPVATGGCNPTPSTNWQNCDVFSPPAKHGNPMGDLINDGDLPNGLPVDPESALVGWPATPYLMNSQSRGFIYCSGNPQGNCPAYPTTQTYVLGTNLDSPPLNLPSDPTWGNFQVYGQ